MPKIPLRKLDYIRIKRRPTTANYSENVYLSLIDQSASVFFTHDVTLCTQRKIDNRKQSRAKRPTILSLARYFTLNVRPINIDGACYSHIR